MAQLLRLSPMLVVLLLGLVPAAALAGHEPCHSVMTGAVKYRTCAKFCKSGRRSHCRFCKCQECDFCAAHSAAGGVSSASKVSSSGRLFARKSPTTAAAHAAAASPNGVDRAPVPQPVPQRAPQPAPMLHGSPAPIRPPRMLARPVSLGSAGRSAASSARVHASAGIRTPDLPHSSPALITFIILIVFASLLGPVLAVHFRRSRSRLKQQFAPLLGERSCVLDEMGEESDLGEDLAEVF